MDAREAKALELAATAKIEWRGTYWYVPSPSVKGGYRVDYEATECTCEDYELRGELCKHALAVRLIKARNRGRPLPDGEPIPKRPTCPRDWSAYNLAQTTEKDWFLSLLADLCAGIPEPPKQPRRGRPAVRLADGLFAAVFKVYSGFSARRFTCDLEDAAIRGHVGRAIHFNSVLNVFESDATTPILLDLIARSAAPLREIETQFAIDSSGFCTARFTRWTDMKYGVTRQEHDWVKAHICCGTTTNVVTAVEILDRNANDAPQFPPLLKTTARTFTVEQIAADKAYTTATNYDAVGEVGGTLYTPFKKNSTGAAGELFGKAFHFFCLHRDEFLKHYHRRSMIESTFSMVKRKFGDSVRSKTDTAMRNEVLAKLVCHNVCCLISAIYELGINPDLIGLPSCTTNDGAAQIIRFPGA
jgi:transposase